MQSDGKRQVVSYLRASTARQGTSGLGLEAQRAAVAGFLNGEDWTLVLEVESGKRNDRPALAAALKLCRKHRATLVIAKLDRLARNVAFISNLMESGVEFVAVDMPQANRFVVHILAAVAEQEAEAISKRTKAALAAAKARGTKLGGRAFRMSGLQKALLQQVVREEGERFNEAVVWRVPCVLKQKVQQGSLVFVCQQPEKVSRVCWWRQSKRNLAWARQESCSWSDPRTSRCRHISRHY